MVRTESPKCLLTLPPKGWKPLPELRPDACEREVDEPCEGVFLWRGMVGEEEMSGEVM
jgi:hypothetical protein